MSHQRRTTAHPRKEVVHRAVRHHSIRRPVAVRLDFHRGLLRIHIILGLQDLLRLRIHVTRLSHTYRGHSVRDHCHYVFSAQR